jgi:hypothetical protein
MTLHQRWLVARNTGLLLALALFLVAPGGAADPKGPLVPDSDYPKLVKRSVKGIQDALKGGKPAEEQASKARTAAVLIAAYAQLNLEGPDGQQRATVRDAALKVANLVKSGKYDEAAKLAGTLPTLKADPSAKKEKVKIGDEYVTFADLMHQFRPNKEGGWGIYGHLYKLQTAMKPVLPREEVNENFVLEAQQVAVTADLALSNLPKGKPKEFQTNLENMRAGGVELAEALKDKDAARVAPDALQKLTTACFGCHKTFRDR